ncbi:MAG: UDP-N-acetylmuramate--L-alanine ligase [Candidatus Omnitrophica bacterium]|nr:UDP-N-acetylmuramate--L-alanine ligase [Candidatus Omnitrophota bacterium]
MKQDYHFIGIGGIGMGTLALLLLDEGHAVSGSDLKESALTEQLRKKGARVYIGHKKENLQSPDFIVYSSAIKGDNPEIKEAKRMKVKILHRAKVLAQIMSSKKSITIAGAHGKTTTTSMVGCLLRTAGLNPTLAVGGIMNNGGTSAGSGLGEHFVAEVDESDGSFLFFKPFYSIITNIDFEHMEYYKTWENMLKAYAKFFSQTNPKGSVIICGDDKNLRKLASRHKGHVVTYGLSRNNDFFADQIMFNKIHSRFRCYAKKKELGEIEIHVPGEHNIVNALAIVALSRLMHIDFSIVQKTLKEFKGVQRRFTCRGEVSDILFIDDYAHHPTEIKATLAAACLLKKKRVIAVFQPHRFSRMKFLQKEFVQSLQNCDYLIMTDIYAASEKPIHGVSVASILKDLKSKRKKPTFYLAQDAIVGHLLNMIKPGDLVLTLGAGNINQILNDLIPKVNERFEK